MGTRVICVYGTPADFHAAIIDVRKEQRIKFVLQSDFDTPRIDEYPCLRDIPGLGRAKYGVTGIEDRYGICDAASEIGLVATPLLKGGIRYNPTTPPGTVLFTPGGLLEVTLDSAKALKIWWRDPTPGTYLVRGEFAIGFNDVAELRLYNSIVRRVKKQFTRIGMDWVGPEALRLMDQGVCLTHAVNDPLFPCLHRV